MSVELSFQNESGVSDVPSEAEFKTWLDKATPTAKKPWDVTVRLVDEAEMTALNSEYRGKDKPTNVLSFPAELPEGVTEPLLGDIIICVPVIFEEAKVQNKEVKAHFAHMAVHGALHCQGYDHQNDLDAEEMESLEIEILRDLGYDNPYR